MNLNIWVWPYPDHLADVYLVVLQTHPPLEEAAWAQSPGLCSAARAVCPPSPRHTPPAPPPPERLRPGSSREEQDFLPRSLVHCRGLRSRTRACEFAPAACGSACTAASPRNTCCSSPIWGLWISSCTPSASSWSPSWTQIRQSYTTKGKIWKASIVKHPWNVYEICNTLKNVFES